MNSPTDITPPRAAADPRWARLGVGFLFFGGGCAALTYEVVWFQLLRLTVGASSISLAITLTAFMAGLCIGAYAAPRLARRGHPLRVIAALELGIGVLGLAIPWGVPWVAEVYTQTTASGGTYDLIARGVVCGLVLLPPTVLMGATLPVIGRWVGSSKQGVAELSWLYAANTLGAVAGTLLTGFIWLRLYSLWTATCVGVGVNVAVAVAALGLSLALPRERRQPEAEAAADAKANADALPSDPSGQEASGPRKGLVLLVIGLSGVSALGAQVLWTRVLALLFAVTVYTFAIILAVFLFGLALGTAWGGALSRRTKRPGLLLGVMQLGLVPAVAWGYWAIGEVVPELRGVVRLRWLGVWSIYLSDVIRCAAAILPATMLWGASFPVALAAAGWEDGNQDRVVAQVYTANTLGAIVGASLFTFVGFGVWGSNTSAKVLAVVACVSGLLMLMGAAKREPLPTANASSGKKVRVGLKMSAGDMAAVFGRVAVSLTNDLHQLSRRRAGLATLGVLGLAMAVTVPGVTDKLLLFGRYTPRMRSGNFGILEVVEGVVAPVGVAKIPTGESMLYVSGKVVATTIQTDMRLQVMLSHLAALTHERPRSVLIVGMGTGVTAGTFVLYPEIERIVICEIEPRVPEIAGRHFAEANHHVLEDPRTEVVFDDARHFLSVTEEKFDIITSDPIHPWVKGASALYSSEYYDLVQQRLNPGGVVTQWVPFYETSTEAARSMLATFFDAFPGGSVWHAGEAGVGQDVVMLARPDAPRLDLDAWERVLRERPELAEDLALNGVPSFTALAARFTAHAADLSQWMSDASINHDGSLRLEYLAGLSVFSHVETRTYIDLITRRVWPPQGFDVRPATRDAVQAEFDRHTLRMRPQ